MHLRKVSTHVQPAGTAQADMGRNFSSCANFLRVKGP